MNSDSVKKIPFLRHDVNLHHNYELIKSGRQVLNLPKEQVYNLHHSSIHDFTLNPKNNIAEYPFNGNSNFYVDFELPKLNYCYHQFVLRFKLYSNNTVEDIYFLPSALMIDRIVLLKNSNVLSELNNEDIMLYNLHKISNKYNTAYSDFDYSSQLGLQNEVNSIGTFFTDPKLTKNETRPTNFNLELPLCLTNSNFLSSAIKNDLVIRIYFRGNIRTSGGNNNQIKLGDLKLMLRMKETSHNLLKESKFNYQFTKKILTKINIPKLEYNSNYTINITGFNGVASFAFIFFRELDNAIDYGLFGKYSDYKYSIDDVSICDNTGKNILQSDIILQRDYNRYLLAENFHQFGNILNKFCTDIGYNDGNFFFVPFGYDGNASYNTGFNGGYAFTDSNYKLKFKSLSGSSNKSLILNILFFSPCLLELENGNLLEILSSE